VKRRRRAAKDGVEILLAPILQLHASIRDAVISACRRQAPERLATKAGDEADTIYAIDRVAEAALVRGLRRLPKAEPVCVIAEGLGARETDSRWRMLVDPIDGTRGLMYQKRSAWILTGVAINKGTATRLSDVELAVQTEIPLVKQHLCDQLWAMRGNGMHARRWNRLTRQHKRITLRRSAARTIEHGFATIVRFFPGARELLGAIDDDVMRTLIRQEPGRVASFEDQYACSGGQLYELMAGHDRFIADLRPLVNPGGLGCHPYDLCTELIAREAGVIITDPAGAPVAAPMDLTTNVAWVGYANETLRRSIEPELQQVLRRRKLLP